MASSTSFTGKINLDIRDSEPDWGPFAAPTAPDGAPNVLYLVWDDTGIATWDCFGGLVEMPAMNRIAQRGIRLSQFHTTALCSPTRAALLTGRNATSVGMATIEEFTDGFPNCSGRIPFETALRRPVPPGGGHVGLLQWRQMPFADTEGVPAPLGENLTEQRGFERDTSAAVGEAVGELFDGGHA
ncbi:sulfatase-like hydrolase/transferase, partial [Mycolicibacter sinensis]|uniref:sulfatase-like hydrolase/transferase n=1 Tax=Mycolicibacter sinensis (strain JDM601) TaxID=875328 RepID=UPI000A770666